MCHLCTGFLFTLEYEDAAGHIHCLKVHKVTEPPVHYGLCMNVYKCCMLYR